MKTIDTYWEEGFHEVEGWLSKSIIEPLKAIARFQSEKNIKGSVLEIGVHHGRFFIPLVLLTDKDETAVGIDVFDGQEKNIDHSGHGSFQRTKENIKKFCNDWNNIELIVKDSLSITTKDKVDLIEKFGAFRLISIDGGHTPEHTVNDLLIAQDILQSGGVIIIDDYYNMHWPGVHEGVARFFINLCPKLKIFGYTQNKLFLTDYTFHGQYYSFFHKTFNRKPTYKTVQMWGAHVVIY